MLLNMFYQRTDKQFFNDDMLINDGPEPVSVSHIARHTSHIASKGSQRGENSWLKGLECSVQPAKIITDKGQSEHSMTGNPDTQINKPAFFF